MGKRQGPWGHAEFLFNGDIMKVHSTQASFYCVLKAGLVVLGGKYLCLKALLTSADPWRELVNCLLVVGDVSPSVKWKNKADVIYDRVLPMNYIQLSK